MQQMACLIPISVRDKKNGGTVVAPCGKCPECRRRRSQSWVFRLQQEDLHHYSSVFLTLTYAVCPKTQKGFNTLVKSDYQDFMKRLRKNTGKKTLRYYACGEYGGQTYRPHYHAILFDAKYDEIVDAWSIGGKSLGNIYCDVVNNTTIAYVTNYMCKPRIIPMHQNDDRLPEFSLMSKGMGKNFLSSEMIRYYEENQISYVTLPGGYKQALPRYYRDKIFTDVEKEAINIKASAAHEAGYLKAVSDAGGEDAYYANRHYAIKAALDKFNKNHKQLRKKI